MAKAFSLASWNVEHFKNPDSRVDRVVDFLAELSPGVFGLYEVEGKEVFDALVTKMPGYSFHITEGPEVQEILVGVAADLTAFFTQKLEFKEGMQFLRPGALLTITIDQASYPILFLHTKSGNEPLGLGLRDDMLRRALDFRRVLDAASGGNANYLFLGDLNTMGMEYTYLRDRDIDASQEIEKMKLFAEGRGMQVLRKDEPATWWNGSGSGLPPSNEDEDLQDAILAGDDSPFESLAGGDEDLVRYSTHFFSEAPGHEALVQVIQLTAVVTAERIVESHLVPVAEAREQAQKELVATLLQREFIQSTRSTRLWYRPDLKDFRVTLTKTGFRFERANRKRGGQPWELQESWDYREFKSGLAWLETYERQAG